MLETSENILKFLKRCTCLETLKQIHAHIFLNGLHHDNYVAVKLVTFCSNTLGNIGYARRIFDSLMNIANIYLWTAIISSYSYHQSDVTREAILIYKLMHQQGPSPNNFTLSSVLKACSSLKAIREGNQVHAHATKLGFSSSIYIQTTLLDMYAKSGGIQEAKHLFRNISVGNVVACNSMISYYAKAGDTETAREIFNRMSQRDSISWTLMISGYAFNGNLSSARELFNEMSERDVNSWNALIAGYSHSGEWYEAINLFCNMRLECVKPNPVTMAILMSACGQLGSLEVARQIHAFLQKNCIAMNVYVFNSLVDLYAKCGNAHESYRVFSEMPVKDVVSYNVMIAGFVTDGHGEHALKLFPRMLGEQLQPDTVTFLGILTACSHSGLVDLGRHYFDSMKDYAVEPSVDHYACIVDLLGRGGFIEEAYELVKSMPVEPHAGVWGALLNACQTYCDIEIGKIAANELFRIEPENPGNYVLLSNIYARSHSWDVVAKVRRSMRGKGVAKNAGCSSIEVNNEVHEFLVGDETHVLFKEICATLRHLSLHLV